LAGWKRHYLFVQKACAEFADALEVPVACQLSTMPIG
jgi:hypothetical protein